jgi:hypothetical protein
VAMKTPFVELCGGAFAMKKLIVLVALGFVLAARARLPASG